MRCYGVLLHISSLPSAYGIGDIGPAAHAFVRNLAEAGGTIWQFLPLNPTSPFVGNSPYSGFSAFAGNPLFISPELMVRDGYITPADLEYCRHHLSLYGEETDSAHVDYQSVAAHRAQLFSTAFERSKSMPAENAAFQRFQQEHRFWLRDYARFTTLKEANKGAPWWSWAEGLTRREPVALEQWDAEAKNAIQKEEFIQFLFFTQWRELYLLCRSLNVRLLADVPIYVTHDSVDVWSNPHIFRLNEAFQPEQVSGVPPDYFSAVGQRWGNPVYAWEILEKNDFSWWKSRLAHVLLTADMVRLDHFRGFFGYWEIPAEEETAVNGKWKKAPGEAFFASLRRQFGSLPFLAENLGVITEDVHEAMREFDLPGMHVLQFAFTGKTPAANPDMPHNHQRRSFVYTGTHDNTTTRAWYAEASGEERETLMRYIAKRVYEDSIDESPVNAVMHLAFAGVAECAIIPMQDVLGLGAEGRMNTPGTAYGNWTWRMRPEEAAPGRMQWLRDLAEIYGRLPDDPNEEKEPEEPLY